MLNRIDMVGSYLLCVINIVLITYLIVDLLLLKKSWPNYFDEDKTEPVQQGR